MNDEQDNEQGNGLSAEEREQFDSLSREMTPPDELERSVVGELRRRGLVGTRRTRAWGWPGLAWIAVPSLAALTLGFLVGMSWAQEATGQTEELPRYLLILRSGDAYQPEAPGETRGAEYADWAMNQLPRGAFLSGEELADEGWMLQRTGEMIQSEPLGIGVEPQGTVAGFFLIQAQDAEIAVDFTRATPHLKYGGTVEVRPIAEHSED